MLFKATGFLTDILKHLVINRVGSQLFIDHSVSEDVSMW